MRSEIELTLPRRFLVPFLTTLSSDQFKVVTQAEVRQVAVCVQFGEIPPHHRCRRHPRGHGTRIGSPGRLEWMHSAGADGVPLTARWSQIPGVQQSALIGHWLDTHRRGDVPPASARQRQIALAAGSRPVISAPRSPPPSHTDQGSAGSPRPMSDRSRPRVRDGHGPRSVPKGTGRARTFRIRPGSRQIGKVRTLRNRAERNFDLYEIAARTIRKTR